MKTKITSTCRPYAVTLGAAAAVLLLATGSARAQDGPTSHGLELDDPSTYGRAAEILVEEALLLSDVDRRKSGKLRTAGRLYDAAGLREMARTTTLYAGIAAYHAGEHATAAHIFLDAADPSLNRGVRNGTRSATARAAWVLRNGELTDGEKASILQRARDLARVNVRALRLEDISSDR